MDSMPVRHDVTSRIAARVDSAVASGIRDVYAVFPEVSSERTLTLTIEQSIGVVMAMMATESATAHDLEHAIRNAMALCAATAYAIGMEVYDARAAETFAAMLGDS